MDDDVSRLVQQVEDLAEGRIERNARIKALREALEEIAVRADEPGFSVYGARNVARKALSTDLPSTQVEP